VASSLPRSVYRSGYVASFFFGVIYYFNPRPEVQMPDCLIRNIKKAIPQKQDGYSILLAE